jgi:hypothetical protein
METEQHIVEWQVYHWRNKGEDEKFPESNESENTTCQNLWDKAVLRGKFNECLHKQTNKQTNKKGRSQVNSLMMYIKLLEKQEQA